MLEGKDGQGESGWDMSRDDFVGMLTSGVGLIGLGVSQVALGIRRQSGYV